MIVITLVAYTLIILSGSSPLCTLGDAASLSLPNRGVALCLGAGRAQIATAFPTRESLGNSFIATVGDTDYSGSFAAADMLSLSPMNEPGPVLVSAETMTAVASDEHAGSLVRAIKSSFPSEWVSCNSTLVGITLRDCFRRQSKASSGDSIVEVVGWLRKPSELTKPLVHYRKFFAVVPIDWGSHEREKITPY